MQTIYEHIEKRVKELGYGDFHIQPIIVRTNVDKQEYEIQAYNELYFLISQEDLPKGTRIVSDSNAVVADEFFLRSVIMPYYEFSGFIQIQLPRAQVCSIEFLKVQLL